MEEPMHPSRRVALGTTIAALVAARTAPAHGAEGGPAAAAPAAAAGLSLRARVDAKDAYPPACRVEAPDVYYPPWMAGTWAAESTALAVEAPSGVALFGGNRSFAAAQADVGVALRYKTRFRPVPFNARLLATAPAAKDSFIPDSGLVAVPGGVAAVVQPGGSGAAAGAAAVPTMVAVVADREFNTGAIAKAALGDGAVRGFTSGRDASRSGGGGFAAGGGGAGDNEAEAAAIAFVLAPAGADGAMFRAELTTTQRRVEVEELADATELAVLETVRQVVTAMRGDGGSASAAQAPLIKEVETTCLYRLPPGLGPPSSSSSSSSGREPFRFEALQRTATYLRPSNRGDPYLAAAVARLRGRAVDIRTYRIVYTLVRPPSSPSSSGV